jgi:hypothetical protein
MTSMATLWARTRIDDLMSQDFAGIQNGIRSRTCAKRSRNSDWNTG